MKMEKSDYSATPHVINMDVIGPVTVYVQGDLEKFRDGVAFMTIHSAGTSFNSWLDFAGDLNMEDIRKRALFLHISIPGQAPGAEDLESDFSFPTMDAIGLNLVTVLDHLRIKQVVGLGDGAGANIMLRFGMHHPTRVHGVVAINTEGIESAGFQELLAKVKGNNQKEELNNKNVAKFIDAYKKRTEMLSQLNAKIKFDVLIIAGMKSKCVDQADKMHQMIAPGLCSLIKVEEVANPLLEAPEKVSEALILFCQGQGLMPTINRKCSRQSSTCSAGSETGGRKMSMTDYDIPNIQRLNLTPRETEQENGDIATGAN